MRSDPADDYEFYPCLVDGAPASIYLNLRFEHAPVADAATRYELTVHLREPGPHGIGTAAEASALGDAEAAIVDRVGEVGLVYVGRLRHRGRWDVTFHGPAGHEDALRAAATALLGDARTEVASAPDPDWRYYRELLLPDAERRRWSEDRRMVQVLQEQGDARRAPRPVEHELSFATADAREAFVERVARQGFTLERAWDRDDHGWPFAARVSRQDPIELEHIHEVVMVLVDAAATYAGRYDRWTTSIES